MSEKRKQGSGKDCGAVGIIITLPAQRIADVLDHLTWDLVVVCSLAVATCYKLLEVCDRKHLPRKQLVCFFPILNASCFWMIRFNAGMFLDEDPTTGSESSADHRFGLVTALIPWKFLGDVPVPAATIFTHKFTHQAS